MGYSPGIGGAVVETPLPSELVSMAPGLDLAAVLASIDRSRLTADAMLDLIAARAKLLWHVQGELLADLAQAVTATLANEPLAPDEDLEQVTDAVGELVGWTVHWARTYAQGQVEVAAALDRRLPMVLAALRDGLIDQAKAAAFAEALACVDDETAARIATRLLPKAQRWTLTQLRANLRYHVDKADPGAARRRYRRRVAQRDVTLWAQPDGTASLYGQGLAPHRAAAAFDRIDRIARAARASGDVRNLAQLRADAMCDVLAGVPFQLSPSTDPLAAADASTNSGPPPVWSTPDWRTESRFQNTKTARTGSAAGAGPNSNGGPASRGGPGGDGGLGCSGHGARGAWPSDPTPPEAEPVGVIDLYDYDRACLTDQDKAWVNIGCEPPGASEDETPNWWHACHPARHHTDRPIRQQPTQAEVERSCSENGKTWPEPSGGEQPALAEVVKSCSENGNRRAELYVGGRPVRADVAKSCSGNENLGPGPSGYDVPRSRPSDDSGWEPDPTGSRYRRPDFPAPSPRPWSVSGRDPEDLEWAAAQADALHDRAILSADILPGDRCGCGGRLSVRPGVVDLQVKLTTLAGLDDHPALIPGLGVTLAPLARYIAFNPTTRPTWRWSVFDHDGDLLHHGVTRHRPALTGQEYRSENEKTGPGDHDPATHPCTCPRAEPGHRRGTVELQLTLATLHELIAEPARAPGWHPVLADIAGQIDRDRKASPPGNQADERRQGHEPHHGHEPRMPDAAEDAFIRARDRSCRAPHCAVPASRCELDHRLEYAKGGPSHRGNVDCRCKRHHHLRERGYQITKTGTTTIWTVPSGRTFTVTTDKDLILTRED